MGALRRTCEEGACSTSPGSARGQLERCIFLVHGRYQTNYLTRVNVAQQVGVRAARLLLQVAHKAVAGGGRHNVNEEKRVEKYALRDEHRRPHQGAGGLQLQKREQVHALVLSLRQQRMNPPAVPPHQPQALKVPDDGAHHAGHRRNSL